MLTPRNHSLLNAPAFVEFDLGIEGFAALVIPSVVNRGGVKTMNGGVPSHHGTGGGGSAPPVGTETDGAGGGGGIFPSSAGFTLAM